MSLITKLFDKIEYVLKEGNYLIDTLADMLKCYPVYRKKLEKEVRQLRRYFRTDKGIGTLIDFYFNSEIATVDEPCGILNPSTGKFKILEPLDNKKKLYLGVVQKDKTAIDELIKKVIDDVNEAKHEGKSGGFFKDVLEAINKYNSAQINDPDFIINHHSSLTVIENYFRSSSLYRNDENGIFVHVHPGSGDISKEDLYSDADKTVSLQKTLGLICYHHAIDFSNPDPSLVVDFCILHRIMFAEKVVGRYKMIIGDEKMTTILDNGTGIIGKTPKIKSSKKNAIFNLLYRSQYIRPFVEYDAKEPWNNVLAFDDNTSEEKKKEFEQTADIFLDAMQHSIEDIVKKVWTKPV